MTDYSKLSDAELIQIAQGGDGMTQMSDDELRALAAGGGQQAQMKTVKQEMHSDLTFMDRLVVKNLSNDPKASIMYLQKKHPKLEFDFDEDQIIAKGKNEKAWRVLDPSGFSLNDLVQDIGDVAYDIGAGAIEGTAAATAGAAGGIPTLGIGALPAAMLAGGTAAAGLEALRQQVGKMAGLEQDLNVGDMAIAGVAGGLMPGLFGTGATAKEVGKAVFKQAAKGGVHTSQSAQRGLVRRGVQRFAPTLGETASGISKRAINTFTERMPEILKIEQQGMKDVVTETAENLTATLRDVEQKEWKIFEDSIKDIPDLVNIEQAKAPFQRLYSEALLEAQSINSPEAKAFAREVKSIMDGIFPAVKKTITEPHPLYPDRTTKSVITKTKELTPTYAMKLQRRLSDIAKFGSLKPGTTPMVGRLSGMTESERLIALAAENASGSIAGQIEGIAEKYGGAEAKKKYMEAVNMKKAIAKHFKDPQTSYNTLRNMNSKSKMAISEQLMKVDQKYGTNMMSQANLVEAISAFAKPTLTALSSMGTTSTSRTIPMAALGAGIGYYAGAQTGLQGGAGVGALGMGALGSVIAGPKALRNYMRMQAYTAKKAAKARDNPFLPTQTAPFSAWHMMYSGGNQE